MAPRETYRFGDFTLDLRERRLTSGPDDDSDPVLSADGASIAYSSRRVHIKSLVTRRVDGSTTPATLVEDGFNKYAHH